MALRIGRLLRMVKRGLLEGGERNRDVEGKRERERGELKSVIFEQEEFESETKSVWTEYLCMTVS